MAEIRPLRAWRYHPDWTERIDELTSPLFDVISPSQRHKLYDNPYNSIHLSVPADVPPYEHVALRLHQWRKQGVLVHDLLPAIYVYYQYFSLPGSAHTYCRKGFIANIRLYEWEEGVVLRHENTIPQSVEERLELLRHTKLNVAPTHGLYTDPHHRLEPFMDEAIRAPIYQTEDYQGVVDVVGLIHDRAIIEQFIHTLRDKVVILADGHHRYAASLAYRYQCVQQNPHDTGNEPYHYHLMYLTNTESDDLRILPTHRLIAALPGYDFRQLCENIQPYFDIRAVDDPYALPELIAGKRWAYGLISKEGAYKIRLKSQYHTHPGQLFDWPMPDLLKALDLNVLHALVIEKGLGISQAQQARSPHIHYTRSLGECIEQVKMGAAQLALINQELDMQTVKRVCYSGYTLPQKSTYFYPKVVCGYLFGSVDPAEQDAWIDNLYQTIQTERPAQSR